MKDNSDLDPEDILCLRSEVESFRLPKSILGIFHEEETEEEVKSVLGLEVEPEEQPVDDPVLFYLHEIGKVSLLTAKDEKVLASKLEEALSLIHI